MEMKHSIILHISFTAINSGNVAMSCKKCGAVVLPGFTHFCYENKTVEIEAEGIIEKMEVLK